MIGEPALCIGRVVVEMSNYVRSFKQDSAPPTRRHDSVAIHPTRSREVRRPRVVGLDPEQEIRRWVHRRRLLIGEWGMSERAAAQLKNARMAVCACSHSLGVRASPSEMAMM